MGGYWECLISTVRIILDSILMDFKGGSLTHEVLSTFMAEVGAMVNSRPLVPVPFDGELPIVLSPAALLTQKSGDLQEHLPELAFTIRNGILSRTLPTPFGLDDDVNTPIHAAFYEFYHYC